MHLNKRSLRLALTGAVVAALALLVVVSNTDVAIMVAAAATLVGAFSLRRYARVRLAYDDSAPAGEDSVPAASRGRPMADEGTIADHAERMRGRFN